MLAIADRVGGNWPSRARQAAVALSGSTEEDTARVMVLADIRSIFTASCGDRLPSATICGALAEMEDRPWPEYGRANKPISTRQLASLLRPLGVGPGTKREGADTFKGYRLADFTDAFSRYLPPNDPSQRHNPQKTAENQGSLSVTPESHVTDEKSPKPTETATCDVVTDKKGGAPEEAPISPGNGEAAAWEADL